MKSLLPLLWVLPLLGGVTPKLPPELQGVGIDQKLNAQIPLHAEFVDQDGKTVRLESYFGRQPVLLALVYFRCPMLCSQILSGIVSGLRPLSLQPGRDFNVVAVSFDPQDTPATAREKRDEYVRRYSAKAGARGWNFLTGSPESIRAVTEAVGFRYRWDERSKMFLHLSGIMILTPEGRVARYLYGVEYEPKDLKLSLIEASHEKIGSAADEALLFCYHYDPATGKYGAAVMNLLRATGFFTLCALGGTLTFLWRRNLREDRTALKREWQR
ncbi:MAG TPA: SCO family protein [Bryobacteraceae bacterium]|nr:SCO family protein [Bryobacteraceae bacterium]